jgi:hypothetical protein
MIIVGILAAAMLLCIFCAFRSLKTAIDTIDAAADFVNGTKRIILVPVVYFLISLIVSLVWIFAFIYVYTSVGQVTINDSVLPQGKKVDWGTDKDIRMKIKCALVFMVFGYFWIISFLNYTSNYICMVSCSTYYFNSNAQNEGAAEVMLGIKWAHLNNTGSIMFGSCIIAIIKTIRVIFYYISKKAAAMNPNNKAFQFIIACGNCYLKCIEKVCDYIT